MELFRVGFRTDIKSNDCSLLVFLILEQMAKDQKRRRAMAGEIYIVIGVMGVMFMAFSLLGFEHKARR
jgi:hypothetical protein